VPQARQGTAISAVANDVNGSDQALHADGIPRLHQPQGLSPAVRNAPARQGICRQGKIPTKSPQLTGPASHTPTTSLRASSLVKDRIRKLPR